MVEALTNEQTPNIERLRAEVLICGGTGCHSSNSHEVVAAMQGEVARREKTAYEFYKAMGEMVDDKLPRTFSRCWLPRNCGTNTFSRRRTRKWFTRTFSLSLMAYGLLQIA